MKSVFVFVLVFVLLLLWDLPEDGRYCMERVTYSVHWSRSPAIHCVWGRNCPAAKKEALRQSPNRGAATRLRLTSPAYTVASFFVTNEVAGEGEWGDLPKGVGGFTEYYSIPSLEAGEDRPTP